MKTLFKILYKALVLEVCTVVVLIFIGLVATLCFALGTITVTTLQLMVSIIAVNLIILFVIFIALFTIDLSTQENLWK